MINLPSDFNTAKAYDGSSLPKLTIGGHICRIRTVETGRNSFNNNAQIIVSYDIAEEGEFNSYYTKAYDYRRKFNSDAKWPGVWYCDISNDDGTTNGRFKGFIDAIEQSNPGYKFNGDERALQGKLLGFNFREEEYMPRNSNTGEIKTTVRPFYAISVAKVREGVIPPAKKPYNGGGGGNSGGQRPAQTAQPSYSAPQYDSMQEVDDDELPF